jgi:hypothetical protein
MLFIDCWRLAIGSCWPITERGQSVAADAGKRPREEDEQDEDSHKRNKPSEAAEELPEEPHAVKRAADSMDAEPQPDAAEKQVRWEEWR